ncbi:MAG: Hsp20/alpha crystallin family protein [Eubacteriales bacterium]|nr:Hsp20/alpha crystallin family protein [Eubacteriales bacterium]
MLMPSIFGENLFDNFFDDFNRTMPKAFKYSAPQSSIMKTDIKESDAGFDLDIELPGYDKDNVQAELKDGYMTITASTGSESEDKDPNGKFIRRERYQGSCSRSFYVGEEITKEDIKAKFENGILKISVPKKQPQPKVEEKHYIAIEG